MTANEPTLWMGLEERISSYGMMLWIAVLAMALLRLQGSVARRPRQLGKPKVALQTIPR